MRPRTSRRWSTRRRWVWVECQHRVLGPKHAVLQCCSVGALTPAAAKTRLPRRRAPSPSSPQMVKLKAFSKFENTAEALAAATAMVDSKLSKREYLGRRPALPACLRPPTAPHGRTTISSAATPSCSQP